MNRIISQANWIDIGVIIGAAGFLWIAMTAKMDSLEAGMDAKTDAIVERMDSNMKIMTKEFQMMRQEFRHIHRRVDDHSQDIKATENRLDSLKDALITTGSLKQQSGK